MAGIEKYYEITEVYAWQWEGNANITIEDIPVKNVFRRQ